MERSWHDARMATLADRIRGVSTLSKAQAEHLRTLCSSWQVLADLSFSDLLLYVRKDGSDESFEICAQLRPFTSQTLYPQDMVGTVVSQPEQPIVERAFREGEIWAQDDPVLVDGVPIRMDAVPVRYDGEVVAVVTKEGSPATSRRPGRLEQVYLEAAEHVSRMICDGEFPYASTPFGDWPRVGDGLCVLDASGRVSWASPNAVSAFRRFGVKQNILGRYLDDLNLGRTPVSEAIERRALVDGELASGENVLLIRCLPLYEPEDVVGALVLVRDVSELRQKERELSVKDATIREIHHRVKNNLQTIASLLRLQARRLESEEGRAALQESVLRIGSIALVHETLSEQPSDVTEFADVARRIGYMVAEGLVQPDKSISFSVTGETGKLPADLATPLAVTVTELMQNSIEHAFEGRETGSVNIDLARGKGEVVVTVRDDGTGIPEGALEGARLGLQIVRTLIGEMGGEFTIAAADGTVAIVKVPVKEDG